MPIKPINYEKTIIYKIVCNDLNVGDVYVGHTTDFTKRKSNHKGRCNNDNREGHHLKIYQTIREYGGWDNWTMVQIENYPCNTEREATARERYWFEFLNANMNARFPQRSQDEYKEEHKEKFREWRKLYYLDRKQEVADWGRSYREKNKERIKETKKIYCETHRQQSKERKRKYYEEHREDILEKIKEQKECECGSIVTIYHMSRHKKSKKHLSYVSLNNSA